MTTNLSRLMGILAIILLSSNPVMAAGLDLQTQTSVTLDNKAAKKRDLQKPLTCSNSQRWYGRELR